MNEEFLKIRLRRVVWRYQWLALWRKLAACWAGAALLILGVAWAQRAAGFVSPYLVPSVLAVIAGAITTVVLLHFRREPDLRWIAQKIEQRHPDLNGVLLTAVQQQLAPNENAGYLQYRVIQEATARSQEQDWRDIVPRSRLALISAVHAIAIGCFLFAVTSLRVERIHGETPHWIGTDGVAVTPGDASVERGDSLVVLARFGGALPPTVTLVTKENGAAPRTVPLVKSLADPVFGGSIPEVTNDLTYTLEYRGQRTREFKVTVYEHPRLVRSDVDLTFPDYTKLARKHIEDTRRVSAVEGTKVDFALQLNKPVKSAKLVARDGKKTEIPLMITPDQAVATLAGHVPVKSQAYDLQLVDAEGRANKVSSPFFIDVQPNRVPELKLASPRGDVRPSALEEVTFDGTVWDDFGAPVYGLAYSVAGGETKFVELGKDAGAKEKRTFSHVLRLEDIGAKPDDLISWYVWADDVGPDGKTRRNAGDIYFAEVRAFDEIFRESPNMESGEQQGQQQGGAGNRTRDLTQIQKQIISATWRLQRDGATPRYAEDADIVRKSQEQALETAQSSVEEARSPREQALWKAVADEMEKAVDKLKAAAKEPGPLAQALPAEQSAYQSLLKLAARETAVTRRNRQQGGGGGGQQANQRQIDELDLKQNENRYETQRQAKAPQSQERREQLAVMNRLQELARRQQDINERMKELQTSLQEAQTEQQREEIRRRLKRLEEEQRQMIADADEVKQRMERAENQSQMSQQRQQLDDTRQDLQRAADAAAQGSVAQAVAAGTRAQRQLQEMREELRKQNSSQFADDLREMRNEARELSRQQEELGQKLEALENGNNQRRKTLSTTDDRKEILDKLGEQKERMNRLTEKAQQISEQAENSEPLLSRQLYDSVRKLAQNDSNAVKQLRSELLNGGRLTRELYDRLQRTAEQEQGGRVMDAMRDMLREDFVPQTRQANQAARNEVDELRRGVERAAESVLGDDTEQLKLAQNELDALADQLRREIAQAGGQPGERGDPAQPGQAGRQQASRQPAQPGDRRGPSEAEERAAAGAPGERSEQLAQNESRPGEGNQPGEQPGQQPGRDPSGRQAGKAGERGQQVAGNDRKQGSRGQSPGERGEQSGEPGQQPGESGQQPGEQGGSRAERTAQSEGRQGQQGQGGQPGQAGEQPGQQAGGGGAQDRAGGRGQIAQARDGRRQVGDARRGGGENRGGFEIDNLFTPGADQRGGLGGWEGGRVDVGPLTGADFNRWAERLRDVEDLVETPEMRNALAAARERARLLRRDFRQDQKKPDWTVVQLEVVKPLVEVRNRVAEELARRDSKESLAPIDRDPVPNRFAESVRRYYEQLGKDQP